MKLHNTLTRSVEEVKPLENQTIKLYTCGLTVYSQPHIGNWLPYIYWDLLKSTLRLSGFKVIHTQNYTDVGHLVSDADNGEDKMEKGAKREGTTAWQIAEKYINVAENEGYDLLKLQKPTHLVRATDYIPQQIAFIEKLEKKEYIYIIPDEGVYFDTSKLSDYGKLAKLDIEGLQAGARVDIKGKRQATDFALWKFSPKETKRDMEWESPWGTGFPGWHLECSVIAQETLGDQIDIHTGGVDHIPVHHTNEIAQTESVTNKQFASYWVHNNHLKVEGNKMSKSLGNIYTLQDILSRGFSLDSFRLFALSKHYRTEGNFTWDILSAASNRLKGYHKMADYALQPQFDDNSDNTTQAFKQIADDFKAALFDDLETPRALAALSEAERRVISSNSTFANKQSHESLMDLLDLVDSVMNFQLSKREPLDKNSLTILSERQVAKQNKNWEEADRLRLVLENSNISIIDTASRTLWHRA